MVLPETVDDEFRRKIKLAAQHQERAHAAKSADAEIEADEIGLPRQVARIGLVARNAVADGLRIADRDEVDLVRCGNAGPVGPRPSPVRVVTECRRI